MHLLGLHLDLFPANIDDYSDQHGVKLHQTLKKFEIYFRTKSKISMLVRWYDYCVTEMKFHIPHDPHSTATNFSTKMAHDDASCMNKFVKELESPLVELRFPSKTCTIHQKAECEADS